MKGARALIATALCLAGCGSRRLIFLDLAASDAGNPEASLDGAASARTPATPLPPPGPATVTVTVNFSRTTGATVSALRLGLATVRAHDPAVAGVPGSALYRSNMALMSPGLLRTTIGSMSESSRSSDGWLIDPAAAMPRWDEPKIRRVLEAPLVPGAALMLSIPRWPVGLGGDRLDPNRHEAFAQLCAELVRLINIVDRRAVPYFEIGRELESAYAGRGAELGQLFARTARSMKAVDPTIKVGGMAFSQAYHPVIESFVESAGDTLDFVSFHGWATGDRNASTAAVLMGPAQFVESGRVLRELLDSKGRKSAGVFLTQWNINWGQDARMSGAFSAVFDALSFHAFSGSALTGAAAFNEGDGWYGKLDEAFRARPAAFVFHLFNNLLRGEVVSATSSNQAIAVLAVREGSRRAVSLVNRGSSAQVVRLAFAPDPVPALPTIHRVDESGLGPAAVADLSTTELRIGLPPTSVTVVATP